MHKKLILIKGGGQLNTTTAVFKRGARRVTAGALTQWDVGQILVIEGLDLPETFEAHFSNQQFDGNSKPWIGRNNQVDIPEEYLESGDPIYVLIYMHYGEHDGKTVYWITIPIDKRPRPTNLQPNFEEQTVISQTIAALQDAAARAAQNADDAEASKEAIQNMHVQAVTVGPDEESTVTKTVDEETGEVTLIFGVRQGEKGKQGNKGNTGARFVPAISEDGVLSWTNNGNLENPDPFDIVGAVLAELPHAEEAWF